MDNNGWYGIGDGCGNNDEEFGSKSKVNGSEVEYYSY